MEDGWDKGMCYQLTKIHKQGGRQVRERFGVRLFDEPHVGYPLVMFRERGDRSIITSDIVRMLGGDDGATCYIQTRNTRYVLEPCSLADLRFPTDESLAG